MSILNHVGQSSENHAFRSSDERDEIQHVDCTIASFHAILLISHVSVMLVDRRVGDPISSTFVARFDPWFDQTKGREFFWHPSDRHEFFINSVVRSFRHCFKVNRSTTHISL